MLRKIPRTGESRSRRRPPCRRCEYKSVEGELHMMDCVAVPPPRERAQRFLLQTAPSLGN